MKIPSISCKIEMFCSVNPSEDPKKIEKVSVLIVEFVKIFEIAFLIFFGSSEGFTEQNISILQLTLGIFIISNFE